ncbi:MAG: hypothetical protein MUP11_12380 [Anaerolineales bacterium]|nr:hypothetical protein [Anaerolineales bacterium]
MSYNIFSNKLQNLFYKALKKEFWKDTYAATNAEEYFTEGVQSNFNGNQLSVVPDGVYNKINTREELAVYDPTLYECIAGFF